MPESSGAENFKVMLFRSLDTAAREAEKRDKRILDLEAAVNRAIGAAAAESNPERMRVLEEKVTRLDVRSGMIGAAGGAIAGATLPAVFRFLFAHLAG